MAAETVPGTAQLSIVDGEVASVTVSGDGFSTSIIAGDNPEQDLNTFFILMSGFLVSLQAFFQFL